MPADRVVRHVTIQGRVQGVGFRAFLMDVAEAHALDGWVRNRRDGSVEAVFAGAADAVTAVLVACRRGPPGARVDRLDDQPATADMLKLRPPGTAFAALPTV
jgi:acylphosphatase